jgi:hypothetical protein
MPDRTRITAKIMMADESIFGNPAPNDPTDDDSKSGTITPTAGGTIAALRNSSPQDRRLLGRCSWSRRNQRSDRSLLGISCDDEGHTASTFVEVLIAVSLLSRPPPRKGACLTYGDHSSCGLHFQSEAAQERLRARSPA